MSFMLFYTDFVGAVLYEGVPSAVPGSVPRQRYEEGQFTTGMLNMGVLISEEFWNYINASYREEKYNRTLKTGLICNRLREG